MAKEIVSDLERLIEGPVEGFDGLTRFPDSLFVIRVEGSRYAANSATLPDGQSINGLACFPEMDDVDEYVALPDDRGMSGEVLQQSFDRVRNIAKSKAVLQGLLLFVHGKIVDYHYIR